MLATEATALVHGRAAAEAAAGDRAQDVRGRRARREPADRGDRARGELDAGLGVLAAFVERRGLVASNGEARRQIKAGGLRVNDVRRHRREDWC